MSKKHSSQQMSTELKDFFNKINRTRTMEKDTYLFTEGDLADEIYIIKSGVVQIGKSSPDGRSVGLRICSRDDIVGEFSLYSHDVNYILNAKVLESGEVSIIKKVDLEMELLVNKALSIEIIQMMSNSFLQDQLKFRDLVHHGKSGALYSTLIRLSNSYGIKQADGILINITLTNQDLANFCGTARESVNRLLNELITNNILSLKNRRIIIHDLQYLKKEINCENCPIVLCTIN